MDNKNQTLKTFLRWFVVIVCCGIVVIMPWLLTQNWLYRIAAFGESTGPIGDTIGGLTAPFIGLLSAFLVYRALRAQIDANHIQAQAIAETNKRLDLEDFRRNTDLMFAKISTHIKNFKFINNPSGYDSLRACLGIIQNSYAIIFGITNNLLSIYFLDGETPEMAIKKEKEKFVRIYPALKNLKLILDLSHYHYQQLEKSFINYRNNVEVQNLAFLALYEFTLLISNNLGYDALKIKSYVDSIPKGTDQSLETLIAYSLVELTPYVKEYGMLTSNERISTT